MECAELLADGKIGRRMLQGVQRAALDACTRLTPRRAFGPREAVAEVAVEVALEVFNLVRIPVIRATIAELGRRHYAALLQDLFGNPFRPPTVEPSWLHWNDGTAVKLAQAIYEERAFGRLPVLADALEDAGCDNADILNHLRGPGPHVRGCWAVDLLLGKS